MSTKAGRLSFALAALLLGSGCTSLQSVSVSSVPRERGRPVQTRESNVAFLGLHFDNDFADGIPENLRRQCPDGKVTGVYSKYESTWYVLVQSRSVTVTGYCVTSAEPPATAAPAAPAESSRDTSTEANVTVEPAATASRGAP